MDSGSIKSSNTCSDAAVSFSDRHCRFSNCVIGQVTERIDGACFVDDSNEIMVLETTKKPVVARKRKRSAVSSYGSCEEKKKRRVSHPLHAVSLNFFRYSLLH
uniref:Uncharacterized protein n=1 Tax=Panagrolaimus superbus TaxID=310955 RepID=A0A914YR66_9BILA